MGSSGRILYSMMMKMMMVVVVCMSLRWKMVHGMSYWSVPFRPTPLDFNFSFKEPYPGAKKCAIACAEHLHQVGGCGHDIYYHIFMFSPVSTRCCYQMIENGERCNNCINDIVSVIHRFKKYASRMRQFTARLLKECSERTGEEYH